MGAVMAIVKSFHLAGIHYRMEVVKCGKANCGKCPHGPYWFAYSRRAAFLKKTYVGKWLPEEVRRHAPKDAL